VISGGGSKWGFAGGVAEYLIREQKRNYELYLGSSTGSLLVSHLALNKIDKIKKGFKSVT
jgi:predicted patatin/cPLA2 family phospholipase